MQPKVPASDRLTRTIYEAIKTQISAGLLGPGALLPSTRSLAAEWGVSRTTATAAYEQLIAEGYLETRQGARARVAKGLGLQPAPPEQAQPSIPNQLSAYGQRLAELPPPPIPTAGQVQVDFLYGSLAAGDFPTLAWKKAIGSALLRRQPRLYYNEPRGSAVLRAALEGYLWRARGLRCEPEQIIIVNGSQQGVDLCSRLLLDPGDQVVIEDPGYYLARQAFLAAGAKIVPVPVDQEGLQTKALPQAKLAYTTPSHQYPLGSVLSASRRRDLLSWTQRTGAYVIEDDYDSEYRFDIAPIPPLQAFDNAGRVIYLGTVSKTLSPTLRLGYLVAPKTLAPAFAEAKRLTDRHSPSLEQDALAGLIENGTYERHIRRVRRRNGERRAALLTALSNTFGDTVTVVGADAGLHVVVWLARVPRRKEHTLVAQARAVGLGIHPITPLYASAQTATRPDMAGLVIGYASLDERDISRGVRKLAGLLQVLR